MVGAETDTSPSGSDAGEEFTHTSTKLMAEFNNILASSTKISEELAQIEELTTETCSIYIGSYSYLKYRAIKLLEDIEQIGIDDTITEQTLKGMVGAFDTAINDLAEIGDVGPADVLKIITKAKTGKDDQKTFDGAFTKVTEKAIDDLGEIAAKCNENVEEVVQKSTRKESNMSKPAKGSKMKKLGFYTLATAAVAAVGYGAYKLFTGEPDTIIIDVDKS